MIIQFGWVISSINQLTVDTDGDGIPDAGDGVIDENDRVAIGSPLPKFTFGWTNTFL